MSQHRCTHKPTTTTTTVPRDNNNTTPRLQQQQHSVTTTQCDQMVGRIKVAQKVTTPVFTEKVLTF